jgi:hypothetical protein
MRGSYRRVRGLGSRKCEIILTFPDKAPKLGKDKTMNTNTAPSGTIVGYDVGSGEKLFTETDRATRLSDQTDALPCANDLYTVNGKSYRVVGVRKGSTVTLCEIDVREEPSD